MLYILNLFFKKIETNSAQGFPCGSDGKESAHDAGDPSSIPESGRDPGEGNGLFLPGEFNLSLHLAFSYGSDGKESACNIGDPGSIPGLGQSS